MSNIESTVKIAAGAIVCIEQTKISGDVTIGSKTIVHPTAEIRAINGPIVIGAYNIIEEYSKIINNNKETLFIGSFNVFEVGSSCESHKIGDYNVLETKCHVGPNVQLTNGCVIGSKCTIDTSEVLANNTMIYGSKCERRTMHERPTFQNYQLDFLTKVLPSYQKIEKANFKAMDVPVVNVPMTPSPSE